jgi:hypothetical protein
VALTEFSCNSTEKVLLQRTEDISSMEECKIPVWARGKMFRHQQGAFSFLELKFSRGELHFE